MANTRETMGEQACLDALIADTLTSFEDDGVTSVGEYALRRHSTLAKVTLPQCKTINGYGLESCTNLEVVDLGSKCDIYNNAFYGTNLKHLVLRGGAMSTLSNTNAFDNTPLSLGEGAVYVPQDLVSTYKANSTWGGFTILPIGEYPKSGLPETVSDSWSDIVAASANGTYADKYAVGAVKSMSIDGTTYYFQLMEKDADVLASDGTTTVPMTWVIFKKFFGTHRMNLPNSSNAQGTGANGGWEHSEMRTWLNDTVLPTLPAEVQAGIKEVRKHSDYIVPGESAVTHDQQTSDKLWIPSAREVFGGSSYEQTGPVYSGMFKDAASRIKYSQTGSADRWWLRSAGSANGFRIVGSYGGAGTNGADGSCGVVLGFCI